MGGSTRIIFGETSVCILGLMTYVPLVSVVVPVFNAQESIRRCLDSILRQNYLEIELLVIDDGSTDASASICQEYEGRDKRVHVLSQRNSGPASARNNGIAHASGVYLLFIDADDVLKPGAISDLVAIADSVQADMVSFNFEVTDGDRIIDRKIAVSGTYPVFQQSDGRECLELIYRERGIANFSWAFMYRMSFLKSSDVWFPEGIHIFEDALFLNQILRLAQKVAYCQKPLYTYQISTASESLTQRKDPAKAAQGLEAVKQIWKICQQDESSASFAVHGINLLFLLDYITGSSKSVYARKVHADIRKMIFTLSSRCGYKQIGRGNMIKIILIRSGVYDFVMLILRGIRKKCR